MKCCLCGKEMYEGDWGNNPWPVATGEENRCCDRCNESKVIPARIELIFKSNTAKKNARILKDTFIEKE